VRIIGIDPGLSTTGYGIVDSDGYRCSLVDFGCVRTDSKWEGPERLKIIYNDLHSLLTKYQPSVMAVEKLFFSRNVTSAMQVGEARGVAVLAGCHTGLIVCEYTPLQVKQAVVGYGRAEKQQVQHMVRVLLALKVIPRPDDAADALAVAICHAHSCNGYGRRNNYV
jgi:crossover junction endodeoxyribonuclease RuvC